MLPQGLAQLLDINVGRDFSYPYRIAKAAQNMLTVCMQNDNTLSDIVVASINPGLLKTDSGARDAIHSAAEGARRFVATVVEIKENGVYHAFSEDSTI